MADTPADKPKRRTTKPKTGAVPAAKAPPRAAASQKPAAEKADKPARASQKPAAPKAAAVKPRTPRKAAAAAPAAAPAPSPSPAPKRQPRTETLPGRGGWFAALGAAAAVAGAWFVWRASRADEPEFQLVEQDGAIEVRKYPALVTAATLVRGEREQALGDGFRTLADYIFAKSRPGPKLAMTAPVLSDAEPDGRWRIRFVMPTAKARGELPEAPDGVELVTEPVARMAAISFSGRPDSALLETKELELRSWLQLKGFPNEGRAVHAFYNAPFLPGPLRRNEVLIMLSNEGGTDA